MNEWNWKDWAIIAGLLIATAVTFATEDREPMTDAEIVAARQATPDR